MGTAVASLLKATATYPAAWEKGVISDVGNSGAIWARFWARRNKEYCIVMEAEKEAKLNSHYYIITEADKSEAASSEAKEAAEPKEAAEAEEALQAAE